MRSGSAAASEPVHRNLEVGSPVGFRLGQTSAAKVDLQRVEHPVGQQQGAIAFRPDLDVLRLADAALEVDVARLVLGDRRLPRRLAAVLAVVVADEQPGVVGQRQDLPDGALEDRRVAAGKVGARGPVVRDHQRIVDEGRVVADSLQAAGKLMSPRCGGSEVRYIVCGGRVGELQNQIHTRFIGLLVSLRYRSSY